MTDKDKIDAPMERKSAEWSEEDEKLLNETKQQLRILQAHISHYSESMSDQQYLSRMAQIENCVSWLDSLKSLRPRVSVNSEKVSANWKPSEEQMAALKVGAEIFSKDAKYRKVLESLYQDLKKLM